MEIEGENSCRREAMTIYDVSPPTITFIVSFLIVNCLTVSAQPESASLLDIKRRRVEEVTNMSLSS
jgi:hypothetical protein